MPTTKNQASSPRLRLLRQIRQLAQEAIYGSLSETYRRCGNPDCRCHHGGPKHGPHLYISYRGTTGKTIKPARRSDERREISHNQDVIFEVANMIRGKPSLGPHRRFTIVRLQVYDLSTGRQRLRRDDTVTKIVTLKKRLKEGETVKTGDLWQNP